MKKLPPAESILREKDTYESGYPTVSNHDALEAMKEFAKLHCKAQLKAILEKVSLKHYEFKEEWMEEFHNVEIDSHGDIVGIDKESIIKAYSLTKIK